MARKRIAISSGGGIAAGAPFALNSALFVSQASPPFVTTGRLARLVDANQSIVAPGAAGGLHTFVVGELAVDSANGARSVLVGFNLRANTGGGLTQADDQVLIGNTILVPAASGNTQGLIAIGAATAFTAFAGVADSFGNSVVIGNIAGLVCQNVGGGDASNAVAIGQGALAHGGSVCIGALAIDSDLTAVCIGQGSKGGLQSVGIGLNADATAARSISIGDRARAGSADTIAIGWFADCALSDSSIAIGKQANSNGKFANIMLGRNAGVALDNFMQIGGDQTYPINEIRFGAGYTQATGGLTYTLGITTVFGGAGNNLAGNGLLVRSGLGTGNWANTQNLGIDLQCGLVQAAGSTQQPYTSVLALRHSDLNVALWGGLGAPFSGGQGVLFVKNAVVNPTVAAVVGGGILSVQAGQLHWLSSGGVDTALTPSAVVTTTMFTLSAGTPSHVVAATDRLLIGVAATVGANGTFTFGLQSVQNGAGTVVSVKWTGNGLNTCLLQGQAGTTVNGAASFTIAAIATPTAVMLALNTTTNDWTIVAFETLN